MGSGRGARRTFVTACGGDPAHIVVPSWWLRAFIVDYAIERPVAVPDTGWLRAMASTGRRCRGERSAADPTEPHIQMAPMG
jgi:hypothetical protein